MPKQTAGESGQLVGRRVTFMVAVALLAATPAAVPAKGKRPSSQTVCPTGTFILEQSILGDGSRELLTLAPDTLRLGACPVVSAQLHRRRDGTTRISAKWTRAIPCGVFGGPAKLTATASSLCDTLSGFVVARTLKPARRGFEAHRVVCGDGAVEGAERCDDGNLTAGDGCDATCQSEPDDSCTIGCKPPTCGDAHLDPGEQCDDGNNMARDGCDPSCSMEGCLVPLTHASVQAALDDDACSTVRVQAGVYAERLTIRRDVAVQREGGGTVVIDAQSRGRTVTIESGTVRLENLDIRNGSVTDEPAQGGCIRTTTPLMLIGSTIEGCVATAREASGGAIYADGTTLILENTQVVGNEARAAGTTDMVGWARGGGVAVSNATLLVRQGSWLQTNAARADGPCRLSSSGGGLSATRSTIVVEGHSAIRQNEARATTTGGTSCGASAVGAGVYFKGNEFSLTEDSAIEDNLAEVISERGASYARGGGAEIASDGLGRTVTFDLTNGARVVGNRTIARSARLANAFGGGINVTSTQFDPVHVGIARGLLAGNLAEARIDVLGPDNPPSATAEGGGLYVPFGRVSIDLSESTIEGNEARATDNFQALRVGSANLGAQGGAIAIEGRGSGERSTLRIAQSLVHGNRSSSGGGARGGGLAITAGPAVTIHTAIVNSTVTENVAESLHPLRPYARGGAASLLSVNAGAVASLTLRNVTMTENSTLQTVGTPSAAGVFLQTVGTAMSLLDVANTVLTDNPRDGSADCAGGPIVSGGYNLFGPSLGCPITGNLDGIAVGIDPRLGLLGANGGPTSTELPLEGSRLIDAGDPAGCADETGVPLATDQRGTERPQGDRCDIGAVEAP